MPYVYVVEMQIPGYPFSPIKIGYSVYPQTRFLQFAHGPFPTVCLGKWAVKGQHAESHIHAAFERYRLIGEWFYPAEELKAFINKRLCGERIPLNHPKNVAAYEDRLTRIPDIEPISITQAMAALIARSEAPVELQQEPARVTPV